MVTFFILPANTHVLIRILFLQKKELGQPCLYLILKIDDAQKWDRSLQMANTFFSAQRVQNCTQVQLIRFHCYFQYTFLWNDGYEHVSYCQNQYQHEGQSRWNSSEVALWVILYCPLYWFSRCIFNIWATSLYICCYFSGDYSYSRICLLFL